MDTDIIIGIVLTAAAFSTVVIITLLSRALIERIASDGCKTARETLKGRTNGQ